MKSVLAIIAGFIAIAVLSLGADMIVRTLLPQRFSASGGTDDPTLLMVTLLYAAAFGVAGCYLTARFSPGKPKKHAMILGWIGLLLSTVANVANWKTAPAWYHVVALLLILPSAWLGGDIRERQLKRQNKKA